MSHYKKLDFLFNDDDGHWWCRMTASFNSTFIRDRTLNNLISKVRELSGGNIPEFYYSKHHKFYYHTPFKNEF